MANKLSQSEIDALVASLLAADNAEKQAADGQSGQGSPETAAPAAGQNAEGAPSEFESVQDLGPVTQAELDAAVAASRAAKMKGTAPAAPFEAAAAAAAAVPAPAPAAPAAPGPGASKAQLRIPPALRGVLLDIELTLSVELGKARLPLGEILSMGPGSVITLDRLASEPLNVKVNGLPAMTAEVIAIGEKYGIRIVESQLPNYAAAS